MKPILEEDAKIKACCVAPYDYHCIGSKCMAWDWVTIANEGTMTRAKDRASAEPPPGDGWIAVDYGPNGAVTGRPADDGDFYQAWARPREDGTRLGICLLLK